MSEKLNEMLDRLNEQEERGISGPAEPRKYKDPDRWEKTFMLENPPTKEWWEEYKKAGGRSIRFTDFLGEMIRFFDVKKFSGRGLAGWEKKKRTEIALRK